MPCVSTWPLASPKNMNASSESGLCATVILVSAMMSAGSRKEDTGPRCRTGCGDASDARRFRSKTANDRRHALYREVDVGVGRGAPQAKADRRARVRSGRTDGLQHVRRRLAARAARGSRRDRNVAERHDERLPFHLVE